MPLKIGGQVVEGPKKGMVVLERPGSQIVFYFTAVTDDSDFEKLCPPPVPQKSWKKELGRVVENITDPNFLKARENWAKTKSDWYFLKSIEESKIEWEQVKMDSPSTYHLWKEEFRKAGFSNNEIVAIENEFYRTNIVTEEMLNEARLRFLAIQAAESLAQRLSLDSDSQSSESGEPAKESESSHQTSAPPG